MKVDTETLRPRRPTDNERTAAAHRRQRERMTKTVLDHYGATCVCCGTTQDVSPCPKDLSVTKRSLLAQAGVDARTAAWARWLILEGLPTGFETLCTGCYLCKRSAYGCGPDAHELRSVRSAARLARLARRSK